jgi:hypothetical protein
MKVTVMPSIADESVDQAWAEAEKALEAARSLPGGSERIEALKRAGKLRFDADRMRRFRERENAPDAKLH